MKSFIKAMDNLPQILKLILCIPALDIVWCIYRLCRSLNRKNLIGIVLAVLTIIPGATFVWIVDLVSMLFGNRILWID